jgi:hypothetical protein
VVLDWWPRYLRFPDLIGGEPLLFKGKDFKKTDIVSRYDGQSLNVIGVLSGSIRETDVPDYVAREVEHLERDVSGKLESRSPLLSSKKAFATSLSWSVSRSVLTALIGAGSPYFC